MSKRTRRPVPSLISSQQLAQEVSMTPSGESYPSDPISVLRQGTDIVGYPTSGGYEIVMSRGGRELSSWYYQSYAEYADMLALLRGVAGEQPDERRATAHVISRGRSVAVSIAVSHQLVAFLSRLLKTNGATGLNGLLLDSFRWHRIGWVPQHYVLGRGSWVRIDTEVFDKGYEPIDVTIIPEGPDMLGLMVTTGEPRIDSMTGLEMGFLRRCLRHEREG